MPPLPEDEPRREPEEWEARLSYERFVETRSVESFDCGTRPTDSELNDFLNTEEVEQYAEMGMGQTTLVYLEGTLAGYYTVCTADLTVDYVKHVKSFTKYPKVKVYNLPSVKIGRLAVQKAWQGKGIGEAIVAHIAAEAMRTHGDGVRLMILEAYPHNVGWYEKIGFMLTNGDLRKEKGRRNRTMFFDLNAIRGRPD